MPALDRADARGPGTLRTRSFATLLAVSLALGVFFGSTQVSVSAFADVHHAAGAAGFPYGLMSAASWRPVWPTGGTTGTPRPRTDCP
ncbi:hypothetical protein P8A22_01035 [Streptomyces laculatispora]|uniref:Uncharacterized protein n=1 Tax=Streptomyces laculatispora TaxID=887464 RepID=A0ABY9HW24_9ACTN|nr:hypothetical protein [Streptomyces laculatispora]WLQ38755.1 hypothetical protein P8A22_01035 [Streptomyces laculatispora]